MMYHRPAATAAIPRKKKTKSMTASEAEMTKLKPSLKRAAAQAGGRSEIFHEISKKKNASHGAR